MACGCAGTTPIYDSRGDAILYVKLNKALYGLIQIALLFYEKLMGDLVSKGFKVNDYDPCVANKGINGHRMIVTWHVDDLKVSHIRTYSKSPNLPISCQAFMGKNWRFIEVKA